MGIRNSFAAVLVGWMEGVIVRYGTPAGHIYYGERTVLEEKLACRAETHAGLPGVGNKGGFRRRLSAPCVPLRPVLLARESSTRNAAIHGWEPR